MTMPAMSPQHYPHLDFGSDTPDKNELADIQDPICKCDIGLPLHRKSAHIPLELGAPDPFDVAVKGVVSSLLQAAQFSAYTTFTLNTGNEDPQQILPRDDKRLRGIIQVSPLASATTGTASQTVSASNTFAAAAPGSVSLGNGNSITGFDITFAPAAAIVTGVATVTNVTGGPLSYQLDDSTSGESLSIRFPNPITATNAGVAPTVNVPAIIGGSAYAIVVYGVTVSSLVVPTASVWVGKREQVFATVKQGWLQTSAMQPLEIRNEQGLWMTGTGNPVSVMVVNERFA